MHSNLLEEPTPVDEIRDKIIEFRDGLPGFPASRQFVMAQKPDERPFVWMHSVSDPGLAFALVDAYAWDRDFTLEIDDAELEEMGSLDPMDYAVYFILRIQKRKGRTTLQAKPNAPLLVNVRTRQARQVVVSPTPSLEKTQALCLQL
jgi:flagellar assembly factor FliW